MFFPSLGLFDRIVLYFYYSGASVERPVQGRLEYCLVQRRLNLEVTAPAYIIIAPFSRLRVLNKFSRSRQRHPMAGMPYHGLWRLLYSRRCKVWVVDHQPEG